MFPTGATKDDVVKYVPESGESAMETLPAKSDDPRAGEQDLGGVVAGGDAILPWRDGAGFTSRIKIPRICLRPALWNSLARAVYSSMSATVSMQ
jgi:hypothetical protein